MTSAQKNLVTPIVIIIGMVAWALIPFNPYGYYLLLRLVCCPLLFIMFLFRIAMIKSKRPAQYPTDLIGWPGIFVLLAILYNPIIQVHLTREVWTFINVGTILLLVAFWFLEVRVFEGSLVFSKKVVEPNGPVAKISELDEARAMTNEAIKFYDSKRYGDCARVLDDLIGKYGKNDDPLIIRMIAQAHFFKAQSLFFLKRKEEGIKLFFDLMEKYKNSKDETIAHLLVSAKEQISKIQPNN